MLKFPCVTDAFKYADSVNKTICLIERLSTAHVFIATNHWFGNRLFFTNSKRNAVRQLKERYKVKLYQEFEVTNCWTRFHCFICDELK